MVGAAGVTAMDVKVFAGACTVKVRAGLVTPLNDAVIWVVPGDTEAASPVAAPIVATPVLLDAQVTEVVITAVVLSE